MIWIKIATMIIGIFMLIDSLISKEASLFTQSAWIIIALLYIFVATLDEANDIRNMKGESNGD